jgi:hypothetical protein
VYWYDVERIPGAAEVTGLAIHVRGDRAPGLVMSSSPTRRLRMAVGGEPILWARIESGFYGVHVVRRATEGSPSIVPPIRAAEAREHMTIEAWMGFFARALAESGRSPLRQGTWRLTELRAAGRDELSPVDRDGLPAVVVGAMSAPSLPQVHFEDWGASAPCRVFPLRAFSEPDASRVKAWRKHARDGSLPPVLLWFVHGLEMMIIIDGHDRLRAAIAEGTAPPVLALWEVRDRAIAPQPWRDDIVQAYEHAYERGDLSLAARRSLSDALVQAFRTSRRSAITVARATPELDELWNREIAAELAGADPEDVRSMMIDGD